MSALVHASLTSAMTSRKRSRPSSRETWKCFTSTAPTLSDGRAAERQETGSMDVIIMGRVLSLALAISAGTSRGPIGFPRVS